MKNLTIPTLLLLLVLCSHRTTSAQTTNQDTVLLRNNTIEKHPIVLKSDTLFLIQHSLEGRSAKKRAEKINAKLSFYAPRYTQRLDSIYLIEQKDYYILMFNDQQMMGISREDAKESDESFFDYAQIRRDQIIETFSNYRFNLSRKEWIRKAIYTAATFVGIIVFLIIITIFFRRLDKRLSKMERKFLARKRNLLRYFIPKDTKNIFVFLSKIGRVTIIITFLTIFLPMMFSFLPWTAGIVEVFYSYLMVPLNYIFDGLVSFIPHLIFILVIVVLTKYAKRVLNYFAEDISNETLNIKGFPKDWALPTAKLVTVTLYLLAAILIFPHLPGSDSPAFKGVSIFFGVLLSLGSSSAVANMIAGIVITYMRPFQIGDRVNIMGTEGDVVEKTMLVTRIKTLKGVEVTIPNANIINNHLVNYSANATEGSIVVSVEVSIGYDTPWEKVNQLLLRAARSTKMKMREPKPFVLQKGLEDNFVTYMVGVHTKQVTKMGLIRSELYKNILDAFNKEGIEILSPRYVSSRDGNLSTIPEMAGKDFRSPFDKVIDAVTGNRPKVSQIPKAEIAIKEEDKTKPKTDKETKTTRPKSSTKKPDANKNKD